MFLIMKTSPSAAASVYPFGQKRVSVAQKKCASVLVVEIIHL